MTGLGKVWMGLHRQLKLEGRWAGAERIFGLSESSGVLACEEAAGEGPYFHGLFFPGGSLLCLSLLRLKDFTLTCWSVLSPSFLWMTHSLSDKLIGLVLFHL